MERRNFRTFAPEERAQMHMSLPSVLSGAAETEHHRARDDQVRNSLVGDSLYVPSTMMVFILLLQLPPTSKAHPAMGITFCRVEQILRDRVRHTALEPGLAKSIPGILSAEATIEDMMVQLPWLLADHAKKKSDWLRGTCLSFLFFTNYKFQYVDE